MNEDFKILNSFLFGNRRPEEIYKLSEGKIRSMTVDIEKCKSENDFYFNLQIIPAPNYKLNYFTKLIKNTKISYLNYSIRTIQNSINENTKAFNFRTFLENEVEYLIKECFTALNKVEKIYDSPLILQAARNLSTQYSINDHPNIKDKHFIYEYLYYSLIHIHLELQANFYSLIEDEPKTIDYFKYAFQFEHTPLLNPTITQNQIKIENTKIEEKPNNDLKDLSTSFIPIKDDLITPTKKIHTYKQIVYKPDWFARFEKQLFADVKQESLDNPAQEIDDKLDSLRQDNKQFFAYYFTPYTKFESDIDNLAVYYKVKEICLLRNIPTQVIEGHKMYLEDGSFDDQYIFSLENIELATLAKLGGTPWSLANSEFATEDELIVGVGAFYDRVSEQRFVASAFSFENDCNFNRFELSSANDTKSLAGAIGRSVQDFVAAKGKPKRLIIHYYKDISKKEVDHIHAQLRNLDLGSLTIFVVTIYKTDSEDLLAFNSDLNYKMPYSGTFIPLQKRSYLLFNNSSYEDSTKLYKGQYGYPFPIKLKLWCSDEEELDVDQNVRDLIDQVYQFSRIYFKSFKQQNLPVTIKYPEMVAKIAPHFKNGIPPTALDTLWFL